MGPQEFFADSPLGLAVHERVARALDDLPDLTVRTSKSQVAFRRRRGFAFLWRPGQYLPNPDAEVVLSIALPRRLDSERFKEVVNPAHGHWMHHLEVRDIADLDDEVLAWLREAAAAAA